MKLVLPPTPVGRGHAFGHVGAGRSAYFADRRREKRGASKVKLRKEMARQKQES